VRKVVIIVPSQGESTGLFMAGARKLKEMVYPGATIVRTKIVESGGTVKVTLKKLNGQEFSFDKVQKLSRVLTVSHGAYGDGPNLAYGDGSISQDAHQPWGRAGVISEDLRPPGKEFWLSVSRAMRADGRIILVGCGMASGYGRIVAKITGKRTCGASDHVAAAVPASVLNHVQMFETGEGGAIYCVAPQK
jgi:hypothetical protein